jgi:hypothetical protein
MDVANQDVSPARGEGGSPEIAKNAKTIKSGKPHGNSRLAKIGIPELRVKGRPGAPRGNTNALKTGLHTAEVKDLRRRLWAWRHRAWAAIERAEAEIAATSPPAKVTAQALPRAYHDVLHGDEQGAAASVANAPMEVQWDR